MEAIEDEQKITKQTLYICVPIKIKKFGATSSNTGSINIINMEIFLFSFSFYSEPWV